MSTTVSLAEIEGIIATAAFDTANVPRLESFLRQQLSGQSPIHFEANHILMKNYQIHSKLVNVDIISQILVLGLMRLPHTDYLTLSYMVPVVASSHPNIASITSCANLLEQAKFRDFWVEYSTAPAGLFSANGFIGSIRSFIVNSLANTFKNIPIPVFHELLGLPREGIIAFIPVSPRAIEVVGDNIVFKTVAEDQPIQKYDETLKVDEILRIVDTIRGISSSPSTMV